MHPELTTFVTAMLPFVDLKLAIPLGIKMGLSATNSLLFAVAGGAFLPFLGLAVATPVSNWLMNNFKFWNKFFTMLFNKTRIEHAEKFEKYGSIIIVSFVAIPIPASGGASGALIAFVFGVDYWKAMGLIVIGLLIQGAMILAGVGSITAIWHHIVG